MMRSSDEATLAGARAEVVATAEGLVPDRRADPPNDARAAVAPLPRRVGPVRGADGGR